MSMGFPTSLRAGIFVALGLALVGCASQTPSLTAYKERFTKEPPSTQWLRDHVPEFKDKAWIEPSKDNVAVYDFMAQELASREKKELKEREWVAQTHRDLTQDWGNSGRGGAAFRQPAYIHVLGNGNATLKGSKIEPVGRLFDSSELIASSLAKLDDIKKGQGYSVYELSRWERYCNKGKGMDKKDWAFIRQVGVQNVPASLVGQCSPPKINK
ncbi:hypothetical protein [Eoetvoesiella caeni]